LRFFPGAFESVVALIGEAAQAGSSPPQSHNRTFSKHSTSRELVLSITANCRTGSRKPEDTLDEVERITHTVLDSELIPLPVAQKKSPTITGSGKGAYT